MNEAFALEDGTNTNIETTNYAFMPTKIHAKHNVEKVLRDKSNNRNMK